MRFIDPRCAAGALVALALALPASAAAAPSVYSVVAKTGNPGVTFATDPTGAALTNTQTQYVLSADGYAVGFAEDNGVTTDGALDYAQLPADYRAPMTAEEKRTYGPAQTGLQAHATCSAVASLSDGATIRAWQSADPSFDYVPWQKAAAGVGDDPRTWLPVVRGATGVDLSALASAADFRAACEGLGGTYHAADTQSAVATALIAGALAPLQAQIATLQRDLATLRRAKEASDRAAATAREAQRLAETTYQSFFTKPIELTLAAKRFQPRDGVALVTGSPTDPVRVSLEVTRRVARRLGLSDTVLVEALREIDGNGAALLTLRPDAETAGLLERWLAAKPRAASRRARASAKAAARSIPVKVVAVSGGNRDAATAKLIR